ncbi:hypothetical protein [Tenacibaculum xiamenense]|uniref:hypothetical protein n=1 Tax=Tenacibaculum xiamenense TaxID=1261553 RepID=UPI0038967549
MCIENEKLTFCTCAKKKIKSSNNYDGDIYYWWKLTSYLGSKRTTLIGKVLKPSKDLGNGLNLKRVLTMLNSNESYFDFDYQPQESDCLSFSNGLEHPQYEYFRVIYKNKKWQEGGHPIFSSVIKTIAQGKIYREVSVPIKTCNWLISQKRLSEKELFLKLYSLENFNKQKKFITALVKRFPKDTYQRALNLCDSDSRLDKILGFRLIAELHSSRYNFAQIRQFLFDKVDSILDKEILKIIIFTLTSDLNLLNNKEIKSLLSLKKKGNDFKLILMDEFIHLDHSSVTSFFIELCRDKNWEVKENAVINLSYAKHWNTSKINEILWENLKSKKLNQHAVYGLACRKNQNIKPILVKKLQIIDHNDSLILEAIEKLGDSSMIPLLESKLKTVSPNKYLSELLLETIQELKMNGNII